MGSWIGWEVGLDGKRDRKWDGMNGMDGWDGKWDGKWYGMESGMESWMGWDR